MVNKKIIAAILFLLASVQVLPQKYVQAGKEIQQIRLKSQIAPDQVSSRDNTDNQSNRASKGNWRTENSTLTQNGYKSTAAAPIQKMDSIVDYLYDTVSLDWKREVVGSYKYDLQGRMTSLTNANYDIQTQMITSSTRADYTYATGNLIASELDYVWVDTLGAWVKYFRSDNEYNTANMRTRQIRSEWNPVSGTWMDSYVDSSVFDMQGNLAYTVNYEYDTVVMNWNPVFRADYAFDTIGFLSSRTSYFWDIDSMDWEEFIQTNYWPDENGNDTLEMGYYWDGFSWQEQSRLIRVYNALGDLALEEDYNFDGEVWYGNFKTEYFYDGMNRLAQELEYTWDYAGDDWVLYYDTQMARDANGNVTVESWYIYDVPSQTFIFSGREWIEYDNSVLWADLAFPFWLTEEEDDNDFVNKVLSSAEADWDTVTMSFDTTYKSLAHYSDFVTAVNTDTICRADFAWDLDIDNDLLVNFTDLSDSTIVSWYWIFGDGETSTLQNPDHLYSRPGTYKVLLTTLDESGSCNNTIAMQILAGIPACNAEFTVLVDTFSRTVTLGNTSEGPTPVYFWDFGDGSVSNASDPVHQYNLPGTYEIKLTMRSEATVTCTDRFSVPVRVGSIDCNADFAVYVDSSSNTAYFRAKKLAAGNSYYWVFGDGTIANKSNPVQSFSHPGYYSAVLTVSNDQAGCVQSHTETILVGSTSPGGKAAFMYLSDENSTVNFIDQSLGTGLTYIWNFNDGQTSTDPSPEHTYAKSGYYTVCLTVASPEGIQNTYCERIFAGTDTQEECLAQFSYTVTDSALRIACQDRSLGNPDSWKWTYNNGWATTAQNPVYNIGRAGYHSVQLTITNPAGCRDDAFGLINVASEARLKAGFGFTIDSSNLKAESYPVDFVGVSLGDAGKLKWSFGDGSEDSTTINPTHIYSAPGTYEVCLYITNTTTGQSDTTCQTITVGGASTSVDRITTGIISLNAYPNPFSERCQVAIRLEDNMNAKLSLYDLMGRKVKVLLDKELPAGEYSFEWDGSSIGAGNYYLILETKNGIARQVVSIR